MKTIIIGRCLRSSFAVACRTLHPQMQQRPRPLLQTRAVVNYEYAFYVSFYLDGSISYEIKLTGELSTNLTR